MRISGFIFLASSTLGSSLAAQTRNTQAADSLGYLKTAIFNASVDTIDTFGSPRGGLPQPGNGAYLVRSLRRADGNRWEFSDTWYDSTGRQTARQSSLTMPRSLATEREWVRALEDSATLLVSAGHATAWVVPHGKPPQLFDGETRSDRYATALVVAAIAKSKPPIGKVFVYPSSQLYGPNPLEVKLDSLRVVRRDKLYRGSTTLPVVVLERPNGGQFWADETTGAELLSRGNAGPERWWWHIRRGVRPPSA